MSRRRFLYTSGGRPLPEPVEVTPDYEAHDIRPPLFTDRHHEGTRAPDGTDIGSRRKRREYMHANGLADASDYAGTWQRAQQQRAEYLTGKAAVSREAVETVGRVAHELSSRRNRR